MNSGMLINYKIAYKCYPTTILSVKRNIRMMAAKIPEMEESKFIFNNLNIFTLQ
jgi:hypothetical protein